MKKILFLNYYLNLFKHLITTTLEVLDINLKECKENVDILEYNFTPSARQHLLTYSWMEITRIKMH